MPFSDAVTRQAKERNPGPVTDVVISGTSFVSATLALSLQTHETRELVGFASAANRPDGVFTLDWRKPYAASVANDSPESSM